MGEILFRGKRVDNSEWVISDCFFQCDGEVKLWDNPNRDGWVNVDLETIGQYTGLKDKNGTKIFEGDVVMFNRGRNLSKYNSVSEVVKFNQGDCAFQRFPYGKAITIAGAGKLLQPDMMSECEVIGNIYENPEFLTHQQDKIE